MHLQPLVLFGTLATLTTAAPLRSSTWKGPIGHIMNVTAYTQRSCDEDVPNHLFILQRGLTACRPVTNKGSIVYLLKWWSDLQVFFSCRYCCSPSPV